MKQAKAAIIFAALFLVVMVSSVMVPLSTSAATNTTVNIFAHKNSSTLNSGLVGNTTDFFHSSAQTVSTGATSISQFSTSWDLYPCLASSITVGAGNIVFTVYLTGNGTLSGVTLGAQVNEIATCGTGTETTLFGGEQTTTISISATETKFQVSVPVSSATTIPSGDSIHFIVYVNPNTADTQTITLYYDASASNTNFDIPLSVPAVTVNSLSISPGSISSTSSAVATVSVSDAFGLYDIASQDITVSIPGTSAYPISAASMTASSSNTPTSYTGTYTYSINPSSTSYTGFAGTWAAQSTVTDNSGNAYTSLLANFNYAPGGNCLTCTTSQSNTSTDHSITVGPVVLSQTDAAVAAILVILIIAAVVIAIRQR